MTPQNDDLIRRLLEAITKRGDNPMYKKGVTYARDTSPADYYDMNFYAVSSLCIGFCNGLLVALAEAGYGQEKEET